MTTLPDLPLIHEDDSYLIELAEDGRAIHVQQVLVFPGNVNSSPEFRKFFELDPRARAAVIDQINRRYAGRMVKV